MALSQADLDREYRAALRRVAQERARGDAFRDAFLRLSAKLIGTVHGANETVERIEREHRQQDAGHTMEVLAALGGTTLDTRV